MNDVVKGIDPKAIEQYADLVVRVGVNVQKDQKVLIRSAIESAPFTRELVKKAYEVGARDVVVLWNDDVIGRTKYELAPTDAFNDFNSYYLVAHEDAIKDNWALISVVSQNPDMLKGIDPEKISLATKTQGMAMKPVMKAIQSDSIAWTIAAWPGQEWAKKVFPNVSEEEAVKLLADAIFKACRVDTDQPIKAWEDHINNLKTKQDILNDYHFDALHFKSQGTDLTMKLPEKHLWAACGSENKAGTIFLANMPTEEVFTMPLKDGVNGVVASKKPLVFGGNVIDEFTLTFKDGKIVEYSAKEGLDALKTLVETDEGSHYLGEVALVPHDSPISNSGVLFYNTLFDENASCHFAIGSAYAFNLKGGKEMDEEQLKEAGANNSLIHSDFMMGSADLDIDGIKQDGTVVPVFRAGNWVI